MSMFKSLLSALSSSFGGSATASVSRPIEPELQSPHLNISLGQVTFDPPSGSTLAAGEPIHVRFNYHCVSTPTPLFVWAKILDPSQESTYEGSCDSMVQGRGSIQRYVHLNAPGQVKQITIQAKDELYNEVYRADIPVDFTYKRNPALEARKKDGVGSIAQIVRTDPPHLSQVAVGAPIHFEVAFKVNTPAGLRVFVEPLTDSPSSHSAMTEPSEGEGTIWKSVVIGEPGELKYVKVSLHNEANVRVFEDVVEVDFQIVE